MKMLVSLRKWLVFGGAGVLLLALAVLMGTGVWTLVGDDAGPPTVSADDGECEEIEATIVSTADLAAFTTAGEIEGDLEGTTIFTGDGLSLTPIVSTTHPPVEPTLSYTGTLEITTDDGTLTTRGVGVFEGMAFGVGTQFDHVIDGTGDFAEATGVLYFNFVADVTGSVFTSDVRGEICTGEDQDEDEDEDEDEN